MANRDPSPRPVLRRAPSVSSVAANIILGLAMLAAIVIGISDFDAGSVAQGFLDPGQVSGGATGD